MPSGPRRLPAKGPLLLALGLALAGCSDPPPSQSEIEPSSSAIVSQAPSPGPPPPQAMGSAACGQCHAAIFKDWHGSHHQRALAVPTADSVLGDFADAVLEEDGIQARFYRKENEFWVETLGANGELSDFRVRFVIGVEPLQQLLVEAPPGRLQTLPVAWDHADKKWITLSPSGTTLSDIAPGDWLHWTGGAFNANSMCIECHATDVRIGFRPGDSSYETTFSEPGVGCEACHAIPLNHPGKSAPQSDVATAKTTAGADPDDRDRQAQADEIEACAPCHSRRRRLVSEPTNRKRFHDQYTPELIREGLYFADGQIQDEVYVLGSFLGSRMHGEGVRCSHCHDPHTAKLLLEGNALCVTCHDPKVFDQKTHHHHEEGSEAALCVECHMRERTYMRVDPRRDHGFHLPRPDLSVSLGTPNACNGCHTAKSPEWARDKVIEWFGPIRPRDIHGTVALAAERAHVPEADERLAEVFSDPQSSAILRATALERLAARGAASRRALIEAGLGDEDSLVRTTAVAATESLRPEERPPLLEAHLGDPSRGVRIEAARILAGVSPERLRAPVDSSNRALRDAHREYEEGQRGQAYQPAAQLNLAILRSNEGDPLAAEGHYRRALELDDHFLPARFNLAMLYNALGRHREAEQQLRAALEGAPEEGEAHYSLGLLLASDPLRTAEASKALSRAAAALPHRPRVQYNAGLAAQRLSNWDEAERLLLEALRQAPENPEFLKAVAILYAQQGRWEKARPHAVLLRTTRPLDPQAKRLLDRIEAETR